jgi:hypothetical protein
MFAVEPIRPDLCYPVGDIIALERAMAVAIANTPPPQVLRAHISKYDATRTIDTVEALYFETLGRRAARSDRVPEQ